MTSASGLGPRNSGNGGNSGGGGGGGGRDNDRNRDNDRDRGRDNDRDRERARDNERERERARDTERERERERDALETSHRAPRAAGTPWGSILAALLAGLILGGGAMALLSNKDDSGTGGDAFAGVIDTARYQAVILSNDKVYFGKLSAASDDFYELQQAFFLRETRENPDAEPVRALLPVNREIHAPDNTMLIRKGEVVLVENLAKDSPILTEIKRQLGGGK